VPMKHDAVSIHSFVNFRAGAGAGAEAGGIWTSKVVLTRGCGDLVNESHMYCQHFCSFSIHLDQFIPYSLNHLDAPSLFPISSVMHPDKHRRQHRCKSAPSWCWARMV
jgi:hypothetical protein